jgi:hypothetical protein
MCLCGYQEVPRTYKVLVRSIFDLDDFGFTETFDVFKEFAVGGENDLGRRLSQRGYD